MTRCICLLAALLIGCDAATSPPVSVPAPIETPPAVVPQPASPEAQQLLDAHNALRSRAGLPPLSLDSALQQAAERHAAWMARTGRMSHAGENGSDFWQRSRAAGYQGQGGGENIAMGYSSIPAVMQGWMTSRGHRANILRREFRHVGAASAAGAHGRYWCVVFGAPHAAAFEIQPAGIQATP